jgi:thiamine kinase-like enzyme
MCFNRNLADAVNEGDGSMTQAGEPSGGPYRGEAGLGLTVEELLQEPLGRPVKVRSLTRKLSPFATASPAEVLSITLQNGENVSLFLKHFGSEQADHPDKQCQDREVRIYEELLRDEGLPVVHYYGCRRDEATTRHQVFLEYIDDWKLEWQELEHWFTAVRRLAHLHAHFAERVEKLLACDALLRFDAVYLLEWANRALCTVGNHSAELAARLEPVVKHYQRVVDIASQQSLTLVHNDLAPKNVLADTATTPARICFIDWEMAGVGCGVMDLVHLLYGFEPVQDQKMRSIYCEELRGTGLLPPSPQDVEHLFAACALHKAVYRLARSEAWQASIKRMAQWVTEIQQYFSQV